MKKKILIVTLIILMFAAQGCAGKDLTSGLSDGEVVAKAMDNTLKIGSVEIDSTVIFNTNSVYQPIDAQVIGKSKIFNDPVLIENVYKVTNNTTGNTEEYKNYIHYLNDSLIGYVFQQGAWYQGENILFPEEIVNNPTQNLTLFVANQSDNGFVNKDLEQSGKGLVKYNLAADPGIYLWALNQSFLSVNLGNFVQDPEALEAMGDFILSIWVDQSSLNIVKMELDFSSNLNRLGSFLKEKGEAPENVADLFENFTYKVTYDLKNHNKLERFSVPLEARMGSKVEW